MTGADAGTDLSGSAITQDKGETRILYGNSVSFAGTLNGRVMCPENSRPFLEAVRKYASESTGGNTSGN